MNDKSGKDDRLENDKEDTMAENGTDSRLYMESVLGEIEGKLSLLCGAEFGQTAAREPIQGGSSQVRQQVLRLRQAIQKAILDIEKTRSAFKSKQLKRIREDLQAALLS